MTMNEDPPRRPGIDDLGGGEKENATNPPNPRTGLDARDWNQLSKQLAAIALVVPQLRVWVRFNAGVPVIDSFAAWSGNITTPDLVPVDNGTGDTTIQIDTDLLANQMGKASAAITEAGGGLARHPEVVATIVSGNYEFRIKTGDSAGALANLAFRLDIF
jgi:hypothetical protein